MCLCTTKQKLTFPYFCLKSSFSAVGPHVRPWLKLLDHPITLRDGDNRQWPILITNEEAFARLELVKLRLVCVYFSSHFHECLTALLTRDNRPFKIRIQRGPPQDACEFWTGRLLQSLVKFTRFLFLRPRLRVGPRNFFCMHWLKSLHWDLLPYSCPLHRTLSVLIRQLPGKLKVCFAYVLVDFLVLRINV